MTGGLRLGAGLPLGRTLSIWTVYNRPRDFPKTYVARRHEVRDGVTEATDDVIVARDLALVRRALELRGLVCLARDPADDPHIVENWL